MDVIVTDPDDGSDCWSLNRKIPARVGDNKSPTRTWNSAKSSKARTVTAGGVLVRNQAWISIVSLPKLHMIRVYTALKNTFAHRHCVVESICSSFDYVCIKRVAINSDSNNNGESPYPLQSTKTWEHWAGRTSQQRHGLGQDTWKSMFYWALTASLWSSAAGGIYFSHYKLYFWYSGSVQK